MSNPNYSLVETYNQQPIKIMHPMELFNPELVKEGKAQLVLLQPGNKPAYIVCARHTQVDIDKQVSFLADERIGEWLEKVPQQERKPVPHNLGVPLPLRECSPDRGEVIPQIRITPVLRTPVGDGIHFMLVLCGASGARRGRVVCDRTLPQLATTMVTAAHAGYSTVFSAMCHLESWWTPDVCFPTIGTGKCAYKHRICPKHELNFSDMLGEGHGERLEDVFLCC